MNDAAVEFSDLPWQWSVIADAATPEILSLLARGDYILGSGVDRLEREFAEYLGVRNVVGCNSGTSALHLAMLGAGIGPGDKVLVPAQTFMASVWGIVHAGAEPVFCDVDEATGTIDMADAERRMVPGIKAVLPVHLYGQAADMKAVTEFALHHGLIVIEDAAQAHGCRFGGRRAGAIGTAGCFSFYPGKNLGAAGEAGAVATDDDALAGRMRSLRNHGQRQRYFHDEIGFNYRMDGIQGLILAHKLRYLDGWTGNRKRMAARYAEGVRDLPVEVPRAVNGDHVWHLFVIRTPRRDALQQFLAERRIQTGLHYPLPCHRQPCLNHLGMDRESFLRADRWSNEGLSLPLTHSMTAAQVDRVVGAVGEFFST
jgi:dTDP-4-amino-4,6-dideoxygalactose transaminase